LINSDRSVAGFWRDRVRGICQLKLFILCYSTGGQGRGRLPQGLRFARPGGPPDDNRPAGGQDWGAPIGLAVEKRRPDTLDRLVLASRWAWPTNGDPYFEFFSRIGGSSPLRLLARHVNLVVNAFVPSGHSRRRPTDPEMAHHLRAQDTSDRRQASAILPSRITGSRTFFTEIESGLSNIAHLPTLIVWGGADKVFRPRERERLETTFTNHQTVMIEDSGLYVESDAPEEFSEAITAWWREPAADSDPAT
jgi:haloalkane dehalogenase